MLISVIVRLHDISRLSILAEAIESLASQTHRAIEPIVVLQNIAQSDIDRVLEIFSSVGWGDRPTPKIVNVTVANDRDSRSLLLNSGLAVATGQAISFLDYDDVVYPEAYELLVDRLRSTDAPVATGGCVLAMINSEGKTLSKTKPFLWGRRNKDLLIANFVPIHSYVINRSKVPDSLLKFDEQMSQCEDYDFLLKLATIGEFDYALRSTDLVEYRVRLNGTNLGLHTGSAASQENEKGWARGRAQIESRIPDLAPKILALSAGPFVLRLEYARIRVARWSLEILRKFPFIKTSLKRVFSILKR